MAVEARIDAFIGKSDDSEATDLTTPETPVDEAPEPQYRMISDDKIPVSKKHGTLWQSRKRAAWTKVKDGGDVDRWDTAIEYYRADQISLREGRTDPGNQERGTKLTSRGKETENIIFANATSLVPAVYAKNPKCEVNVEREDMKQFAGTLKHLINVLISKKSAPGVNLKQKARRSVLMATLTNYAYVEVGYTRKEDATETSLAELHRLSKELASTKKKGKITEIEQKLLALEDKVDLLRPAGPWLKFRKPHDVLIDPDANTLDEAQWVMIADYLDTEFVKVVYGSADEDGKYKSIFEPSHVLKVGSKEGTGLDDEIATFSIFDASGDKSFKDYGYDDEASFKKGQRTKVWYVWDKATRRIYLYNDGDWKWPLWVWDDLYEFDDFFPIVPLEFYTDPSEYTARGEITYYIDQQDAINDINNEVAKVRDYIVGKVVYNQNVLKGDAEKALESFISGTSTNRALGLNVPPDTDLTKVFAPFVPQSAHMLNTMVFDKQKTVEAIDRVSSVTNVMRGVEYKTNTTNKAIDSYESNTQTRLDEKIDQVEEFIGDIAWKIAQVCVKFNDEEMVGQLLGDEHLQVWKEYLPKMQELKSFFAVSVVGGSTLKATSTQKKQQAAQLGQILGQFAKATPAALIIALKVMSEAYDEIVITEKDWQFIMQSIEQQLQKGNTEPGQGQPAQGGGQEKKPGNDNAGADEQQQGQDHAQAALAQVEQIIDSLPAPLKKEFASMIAADIPIKQALASAVQDLQAAQAQQGA